MKSILSQFICADKFPKKISRCLEIVYFARSISLSMTNKELITSAQRQRYAGNNSSNCVLIINLFFPIAYVTCNFLFL